jgi:transketolase
MKLAFIQALTRLAREDNRIVLLTGDLGFGVFDEFAREFGPRYVNVGVAEAQLIMAAAGMAAVGMRPVTYSIASFATCRCFEQLKLAVAYAQLPVIVVGAGGGYAYSSSGVTHHAGEDISLLCALPGMTVVAPGDPQEAASLLPQMHSAGRCGYFRIGRGKEPACRSIIEPVLGKARLMQHGRGVAVLSTGEIASEVQAALDELRRRGVVPSWYQYHTIKPLDCQTLDAIAQRVQTIVVVEEHLAHGGLAAQVSGHFASRPSRPALIALNTGDGFVLGSPHKDEFRRNAGLCAASIAEAVMGIWKEPQAAHRAGSTASA